MLTWPHRERGVPNLFGHLHTRPDMPQEGADKDLKFWPLQYDVGVDNNNYLPISFEQVKKIITQQLFEAEAKKVSGN